MKKPVASYDKAITTEPDYTAAWVGRGYSLVMLGRYAEAVASFDKAIKIESNHFMGWCLRGFALDELGRYADAVESFDKAIAINKKDPKVWNNRGMALINLGRYAEDVSSFDKAIAIEPNDAVTLNNRDNAIKKISEMEDRKRLVQLIKKIESFGILPPQIKKSALKSDSLKYPDEVVVLIGQLNEFLTTARPQIKLVLSCKHLALSTWGKAIISITNTGSAHAKDITFKFPKVVEVHRIKTMEIDVRAGESKQFEIPIKAKDKGTIPLDITVTYRDALDNSYSDIFDFDVEVIEN